MKKKDLLAMRPLKATPQMIRIAAEDIPVEKKHTYWHSTWTERVCRYDLFLRCAVQRGILKVALFNPDAMRLGGCMPVFELFIDGKARRFLTYDCIREKWLTGKLDRIGWREPHLRGDERWLSPADAARIKQYLKVEEGSYSALLSYQMQIREEELDRRHKRKTGPWDKDLSQIRRLPRDWEHWVGKTAIPENFIFYRYIRKGATMGYCTFCEKDVPIKTPRHNKAGQCLCCRNTITFKALGKTGWRVDTKTYIAYLIQRFREGFVIRAFKAGRQYLRDRYEAPEQFCWEVSRAIYDRCGRPLRTYYWGNYCQREIRWISGQSHYPLYYGDCSGYVYAKTLPDLAQRGLARTGLMEYIKRKKAVDPDQYLTVLDKVPQLELIEKASLPVLADECINHYYSMDAYINMSATSLPKVLRISGSAVKRLRANGGGVEYLRWLQYEKTLGKDIPDEVIKWFCEAKLQAKDIQFIMDRMSPLQICNYLRRNMASENMSCQQVLTTWKDYLSMAVRFHLDVYDKIVYRTNKLRLRHDELAARSISKDVAVQAGEILTRFPHVDEICQSLAEKYSYSDERFTVLVPSGVEEIIYEGRMLHHCISNSDRYWDRIERRESYLLFLRKTEEPRQSYYTLEVEPDGTVRQVRTYFDRQDKDIKKIKAFLRGWQAEVVKRLTESDERAAKSSRRLREQEFIQLRQDQVKIHTGDLAGHLLVDVLTADLMETAA